MTRRVAGVVLAGGRSERFGSDKAQALYRGRMLIEWSIAAIAPHVDLLLVSGASHGGYDHVGDLPSAHLGPLGGLAGALAAARERGYAKLVSVPCDTPHIPEALIASLAMREQAAYVAGCPVIGCWPAALAPDLLSYLVAGKPRAVRQWARHVGAEAIETAFPIANINLLSDLGDVMREGDR